MTKTFFLVAGEPSGDALGASLMAGLKSELGEVQFAGVGGELMAQQGLTSQFPMRELSVMGIAEVLPKLFHLLKRVRETADAVIASGADALITIDSPDFCLRVAKAVKRKRPDLPTIHYVAPSVWAWRPKRAFKMAKHIDHVLALLPFEPPYMEEAGMTCDFVGHPVVTQRQPDAAEVSDFRDEFDIPTDAKILLLLPGSRTTEVSRLAPIFKEVADRLLQYNPELSIVIPAVKTQVIALEREFESRRYTVIDPRDFELDEAEKYKRAAFAAADVALAASGTVSLELAAAQTPMVIAYKMKWLSSIIMKQLVKLETVTLVNLVTYTRDIPELLLKDCTADKIYPHVHRLLTEPDADDDQQEAMLETMEALGAGGEAPGVRAAKSVMQFLDSQK